jgi:hypothetical protein
MRLEMGLQRPCLGEGSKAAVIGPFDVVGEAAGRQFSGSQMIAQTFTAHALLAASGIGTVAVLQILLFLAFHNVQVS